MIIMLLGNVLLWMWGLGCGGMEEKEKKLTFTTFTENIHASLDHYLLRVCICSPFFSCFVLSFSTSQHSASIHHSVLTVSTVVCEQLHSSKSSINISSKKYNSLEVEDVNDDNIFIQKVLNLFCLSKFCCSFVSH
jgi:hypothetical protein